MAARREEYPKHHTKVLIQVFSPPNLPQDVSGLSFAAAALTAMLAEVSFLRRLVRLALSHMTNESEEVEESS